MGNLWTVVDDTACKRTRTVHSVHRPASALIRCTALTPTPASCAVLTMPVPFASSRRTVAALSAAIDSAQWYLTNTKEGTQPGEYTKGTQTTLLAAVTAAQAVVTAAATTGTQAEVTAATANLNAAITAYEGGKITAIASSSLVAYWKFNGDATDASGNGHTGTLEAGPVGLAAVPGPVPNLTNDRFGNANSAYHFAGGGNIDIPYSPALEPKALTVSLWERQDSAGRTDHRADCYMIALNRWNGWKFQLQPSRPFLTVDTDTTIYDRDAALDITIGTTVGAGPWHHLVATYDGAGNEVFYVDGTMVKTWTNLKGAIKVFNPTVDLSAIIKKVLKNPLGPSLLEGLDGMQRLEVFAGLLEFRKKQFETSMPEGFTREQAFAAIDGLFKKEFKFNMTDDSANALSFRSSGKSDAAMLSR